MEGIDLEFEEFVISETVGLTLHRSDFVVGALQRAGGNSELEVVEDSSRVSLEGAGELLQDADAGSRRPRAPGGQVLPGRAPVGLLP